MRKTTGELSFDPTVAHVRLRPLKPLFVHRSFGGARPAMAAMAAVAMLLPAPTMAQVDAKSRDALMQQIEQNQADLKRTEIRQRELAQELDELAAARRDTNERLIKTASQIQDIEIELTAAESRLGELQVRDQILRGSLSSQHARMARLLAAMQRMGRNPPPVIVTQRKDALAMVRSAMLLARAFPELRTEADILSKQLAALTRVKEGIRTEQTELREKKIELASAQGALEESFAEKRRTQAQSQGELASIQAEAGRLRRSGATLQDLIVSLDRAVAEQTRLGEYNRKLAAAQAQEQAEQEAEQRRRVQYDRDTQDAELRRLAEAATRDRQAVAQPAKRDGDPEVAAVDPRSSIRGTVPSAAPTPSVSKAPPAEALPGASLTPGDRTLSMRADRLTPAVPFTKARGTLPMPVVGETVLGFDDTTRLGRRSKGLVIEARANAQITSPADGWIVYAGPFRSYGQILIINAGGGYHLLLAGLSRIDVQLGQFVLASEPIGAMGSAPSQESGTGKPVLYVEFRKDGESIDPSPWWKAGRQVAQR